MFVGGNKVMGYFKQIFCATQLQIAP